MRFGKIGCRPMMKQGKTARDYVQNGLFRQVDAIENLGYGQHTDTPTAWHDLIKNDNWNIYGASYRDGMFIKDDATTLPIQVALSQAEVDAFRLSSGTIEIVVVPTSNYNPSVSHSCFMCVGWGGSLGIFQSAATVVGLGDGNSVLNAYKIPNFNFSTNSSPTVFSVVADTSGTRIYVNGIESASFTGKTSADAAPSYATWNASIGVLGSGRRQSTAPQYSLPAVGLGAKEFRLYSRALTADEIAANYAVDKARFNLP